MPGSIYFEPAQAGRCRFPVDGGIGFLENSTARRRPFIVTAIFTGMRLSKLRGLRWPDIDLEAGVIHVRQRADAWGRMGPPKSKSGKRDIPLAPLVLNALKQWRIDCPKGELDLVSPNNRGKIERMSNIHEHTWYRYKSNAASP